MKYRIYDSYIKEYRTDVILNQNGKLLLVKESPVLHDLIDTHFLTTGDFFNGHFSVIDTSEDLSYCTIEWNLIDNFYENDIVQIDDYIGMIELTLPKTKMEALIFIKPLKSLNRLRFQSNFGRI